MNSTNDGKTYEDSNKATLITTLLSFQDDPFSRIIFFIFDASSLLGSKRRNLYYILT